MDLVGPLPTLQGGNKFTVVEIEYFIRWIEAKPLVTITSESVKKFFWQNTFVDLGTKEWTMESSLIQTSSKSFVKVWGQLSLHLNLPPKVKWSSRKS
jgi:hypothetical protein